MTWIPVVEVIGQSIATVVQSAPTQVLVAIVALSSFYKNFVERPNPQAGRSIESRSNHPMFV